MAAPVLIQERDASFEDLSTTPLILVGVAGSFDSNVTAGSTIAVVFCGTGAGREFSVEDDIDGAYSEIVSEVDGDAGARRARIFVLYGATGGATTITVTATGNANGQYVKVFEISETNTSPVTSTFSGTSGDVVGGVYPCSADGTVIDVANPNFAIAALQTDAATSGFTAASGWMLAEGSDSSSACQFRSGSALANERGNLQGSGADRDYAAVIVAFEEPGGGGPSAIAGTVSLSMSPSGAIVGAGALSGEAGINVAAAGAIVGTGNVTGAVGLALSASGTVTGAVSASGMAALSFGAAATLDAIGTLAGAVPLSVSLDGELADANGDQLVGVAGLTLGAAGAIDGIGGIEGSAAAALGAAGLLGDGNSGAIAGAADFQLAATGAMTGTGSLKGTVTIVLGASADLIDVNLGADPIAGLVAMAIAAVGEITGAHAIDGSASITIGLSADLIDAGSLVEVTLVGRFFRRGTDTTWLPSSGGYRYLTKVYLDQPDVDLLDDRVRSREYEMTFEAAALPALERGESVVVGGTTYTVREAPRLIDDGVIARTLLTKPDA